MLKSSTLTGATTFAITLVALTVVFLSGCAGSSQGSVPMLSAASTTLAIKARAASSPQGGSGGSSLQSAFLGCPYPSGDVYQVNISGVAADPNSAAYIAAVLAAPGGSQGFEEQVNTEVINGATNSTPLVTVHPGNSYDIPYSPIPWQSNFFIQQAADHHAEVANAQSCQYYEGYETTYEQSTNYLSMYNNEYINLTQPFVRPATGALSTATGIPLGLLAVRPEEIASGVILHAIGWDAVAGSLNGAPGAPCVNPAGKIDCTDGNTYKGPPSDTPMPYGSHARLQGSFNISGFPREAKIVATAMKTYGLYIFDTGNYNAILLVDDQDGTQTQWTQADANAMSTISPANFDIVPPPTSGQTDPRSKKRR